LIKWIFIFYFYVVVTFLFCVYYLIFAYVNYLNERIN